MTSEPDGPAVNDEGNSRNPSGSDRRQLDSEATVRSEHATTESTQTNFDETVVQGSQIEHLTKQVAPRSMLGQFGRYMIQGKLGEGGMGAVYIARDTQLDRDIALKIPKFSSDDQASIEWFYREARSMATVHHPNICPIHDVGEIDGIHYMSMGYIEGRPLTHYVKSDKPIQARQVAAVVRKIAIALEEAHRVGIVHRDLKPDNIMINTRREPVIMDFGLARRQNPNEAQLTKTGQVMGTPSYMAPEQVEGNNELIGPRTDVYALGVIMYQMLCGQLPFKGVVTLVLAKIITEQPPDPSEIKADVDPELERICLKAKERDPAERYQTAAELAKDLKKYLARSSSGDTMRRAKATEESSQDISQTDQLANEYFDVAPAPYSVDEPTQEYQPVEEDDYVPYSVRQKQDRSRTRKKTSNGIDPLWLKVGGGGAACLVVIVLFLMFKGDDSDVPPERPAGTTALESTTDQALGSTTAQKPSDDTDNVITGREILTLTGHTDVVRSVAYSHDGTQIASGGNDMAVRLWNATTGRKVNVIRGHNRAVTSIAFSRDGQRLVSGSSDQTVKVWTEASWQTTRQAEITLRGHSEVVRCVAFSPDGTKVASASYDETVIVWNVTTGREILTFKEHSGSVNGVVFSPDGTKLASAGSDKTINVWDADTGKVTLTLKGHSGSVNGVTFSHDGIMLASAGQDKNIKVWDAATGQAMLTLKGHTDDVSCVAFSPDGKWLASASWDQSVKVWNAVTGREKFTLQGHTDRVSSVAFSPNGQQLASASSDNTVKVWNVPELSKISSRTSGNPE